MSSFIHEDGKGNMSDDQGNEAFAVDMEVDDEAYPLENITYLNQYFDLKPTERMEQEKKKKRRSPVLIVNQSKRAREPTDAINLKIKSVFFFSLFTRKIWE